MITALINLKLNKNYIKKSFLNKVGIIANPKE